MHDLTNVWTSLYPITPVQSWIAEPPAPWQQRIPEKLVRCLWFDARWRPAPLSTLDGREVTVLTPGRWNLQAGPDFQQAHLLWGDGVRQQGDIEIHCYASGWTAHRHHLDARYNNVILHVVLWQDRPTLTAPRADGYGIPQVALASFLPRPVASYQAEIVQEDYPYKTAQAHGQCYAILRQQPLPAVREVLNRAGDSRLQQRLWRWARRAEEVDVPQVWYEALLRACGSTGHRQHFQDLARTVPWMTLQHCLTGLPPSERGMAAEALLLGLAGMYPQHTTLPETWDAETAAYVHTLQRYWQTFPAELRQHAWHDVTWRQPHVRPANTPERRLAAMAQLLAAYPGSSLYETALALGEDCVAPGHARQQWPLGQALIRLLDVPTDSYWTRRAYLGGRLSTRQRLLGLQRARIVVIDAMLPVCLLTAQQRHNAHLRTQLLQCYHTAPCLPDNHLLRYMRHRLLGNAPDLLGLVTGARQQQGLLQLFVDFCGNDEGACQGCGFPLPPAAP